MTPSITVNSTADILTPPPGTVTLRSAIAAVNAGLVSDNTIILPAGDYKIMLVNIGAPPDDNSTGEFVIKHAATIQGAGAGVTTIDGSGLDRVFQVHGVITANFTGVTITGGLASYDPTNDQGAGVYADNAGASLTFTNSIVTNNSSDDSGGGIYSSGGDVTLHGTSVTGNHAADPGGGIYIAAGSGALLLDNSHVDGNVAKGSGGGGIWDGSTGDFTVQNNSTINNNTSASDGGGAVIHTTGAVTISDSSVNGNTADGRGGGLDFDNTASSLTVTNSHIDNNHAKSDGGGVNAGGTNVSLTNSSVSGNTANGSGGGIADTGNSVTLASSHVDRNIASGGSSNIGGGIAVGTGGGTVMLTGSTVDGNSATSDGGGIHAGGDSVTLLGGSSVSGNYSNINGGGIDAANNVVVTDSTVSNNTAKGKAGGIHVQTSGGNVTLTNSHVDGNTSISNEGGGIYGDGGTISILGGSTVNNNKSEDDGGGIFANSAAVVITSSTISGNVSSDGSGGGVDDAKGVTVTDSLISNNAANNGTGGGFHNEETGGDVMVIRSIISGNYALDSGGGFASDQGGAVTIVNSTIRDNKSNRGDGGGFAVTNTTSGPPNVEMVTVTGSTISGNGSGGNGGGVALESTDKASGASKVRSISASFTNDTIGGNSAAKNGGGIYASHSGVAGSLGSTTVSLLNDTIAFNLAASGGGVFSNKSGAGASATTISLQNTIVADSPSGSNFASSGGGSFASNGGNLSSDGSGTGFLVMPGDQNNTDPKLGVLKDNGGTVILPDGGHPATYALLVGSPALEAGLAAGAPATDERGFTRPDDGEAKPDIGAFEQQAAPNTTKFAVGLGANGSAAAVNLAVSPGSVVSTSNPFPGFAGAIHVANGVAGNGDPIEAFAAGPGGGPRVRVIDVKTGALLGDFYAFSPAFSGGVSVALADVNHDGVLDVIVGAGPGGGPEVKVIDGTKLGQNQPNGEISNAALLGDFYAYAPSFTGGVNVAGADFNGDHNADVVTGAGPGGGPEVKVIDATKLLQNQANGEISNAALLADFYAYNPAFSGGVYVAAGDFNGDGTPDLITGAGAGGGPHVKVIDGMKLTQNLSDGEISDAALLASFYAYDPAFSGGVTVDTADVNGDGLADIVTGAGPGGGPHVKVFRATDLAVLDSFYAADPNFTGGVFV